MMRMTLAALALLAAPAWAETVTLTDSLGRTLAFDAPPARIVALYNPAFGQMASLGVRPVGVIVTPEMLASEAFFFADPGSLPVVSDAAGGIDPELVAAADPDLILGWDESEARMLEGIAPLYAMAGINDLDGYRTMLRDLGAAMGLAEEAEAAIAAFDARYAAYAALADADMRILKIGLLDDNEFQITSENDPACKILDDLAVCDWADPTGDPAAWSYTGTAETLLALDPDVIVLNNWSALPQDAVLPALADMPLWGEIRAVREGRVVWLPDYNNPNASSLAAATQFLDTLVPAIFPDIFPEGPLTDAQVATALQE